MAYHKYMTQIAIILGADPETASKEMQDVLKFEILLANVSKPLYQCDREMIKIISYN